ncbi:MAG: hypothetical protein JWM04_227 [Verrucomicrobiales bacterium]|nr:hypothetical protein [Verrucomicrobiales bacterium]
MKISGQPNEPEPDNRIYVVPVESQPGERRTLNQIGSPIPNAAVRTSVKIGESVDNHPLLWRPRISRETKPRKSNFDQNKIENPSPLSASKTRR